MLFRAYRVDNKALTDVQYQDLPLVVSEESTANLDVLWQTSLLFSPTRAAWSGLIHCVHITAHPGKSCPVSTYDRYELE